MIIVDFGVDQYYMNQDCLAHLDKARPHFRLLLDVSPLVISDGSRNADATVTLENDSIQTRFDVPPTTATVYVIEDGTKTQWFKGQVTTVSVKNTLDIQLIA